jgi:hypothetical protein
MAHTEIGFQVIQAFVDKISAYGHADFEPKLNGRTIVLMVSPLPKNKRAKHPQAAASASEQPLESGPGSAPEKSSSASNQTSPSSASGSTFTNNPFSQLESAGS